MVELGLEVRRGRGRRHRRSQALEGDAVQRGDIGLLPRQIDERGTGHGEHGKQYHRRRDEALRPQRQVLDGQHGDCPQPQGHVGHVRITGIATVASSVMAGSVPSVAAKVAMA